MKIAHDYLVPGDRNTSGATHEFAEAWGLHPATIRRWCRDPDRPNFTGVKGVDGKWLCSFYETPTEVLLKDAYAPKAQAQAETTLRELIINRAQDGGFLWRGSRLAIPLRRTDTAFSDQHDPDQIPLD